MSNPIADTAEYFSEKEATRQIKPGLRIYPGQSATTTPQDILSPESPVSRRPIHLQQQHHQSDFDPKLQWKRVMNRLPTRRHSSRRSSQDDMNGISDSDRSSNNSHNHFEMSAHVVHGSYVPPEPEDDVLPSTEDIKSMENKNEEDSYFTNPFREQDDIQQQIGSTKIELPPAKPAPIVIKPIRHHDIPSTSSGATVETDGTEANNTITSTGGGGDEKAKKNWGKTLDKVRLIANLHTLPHQSNRQSEVYGSDTSSIPLAPYYPPLFDPVFIALSTDQHGDRWAPVLLPFIKVKKLTTFTYINILKINSFILLLGSNYRL